MEIGPIAPAQAVDKALAAWAAAVEALHADGAPELGVPVAAGADGAAAADPSVPVSEPSRPGVDTDSGHEAVTVQTAWRAPTPAADVARVVDPTLNSTPAAQHDLAVPAAMLVPALLSSLQVEPATHWPLPHPAAPDWTLPPPGAQRRREPPPQHDDESARRDASPEQEFDGPTSRHARRHHDTEPPAMVFDAAESDAWCDALSAALRRALAARVAPRSLLAAAEQWQRGRCVVLACPQGSDPAGPAWAFVLWPRPAAAADDGGLLALFGLRVEARLHWRTLPPTTPWCHVRVVKEHHPRTGRQLVSSEIDAAAPGLPCEVQLGPVLARSLRWCEVRLHVGAAQRFWAALGRQWSVHVVVSAQPLLPVRTATTQARPC